MTPPVKPLTAPRMAVRTAVILFAFVVVFTALLAAAYTFTLPAIEAAAAEEKMKLIDEVLPRSAYDNDLLKDTLTLGPAPELGLEAASTAYRARRGAQTVALVFEAIAPDGYAGKIRLLLAVAPDGTVRTSTAPFSPSVTTVTDLRWLASENEYLSGVPQ